MRCWQTVVIIGAAYPFCASYSLGEPLGPVVLRLSGGSVEEIGNRFEGGGCPGSLSSCDAPVFEPPLEGSGGDDEFSVGELLG